MPPKRSLRVQKEPKNCAYETPVAAIMPRGRRVAPLNGNFELSVRWQNRGNWRIRGLSARPGEHPPWKEKSCRLLNTIQGVETRAIPESGFARFGMLLADWCAEMVS